MSSTKFSQRPAPRKRPWICKASPICLPPPVIPSVLICSFWVRTQTPTFPAESIVGSMILLPTMPGWIFAGEWSDAPEWMKVIFEFFPLPNQAAARGDWHTQTQADTANWETKVIPAYPPIFYQSFVLSGAAQHSIGEILITG